jgi:hypothetical protein
VMYVETRNGVALVRVRAPLLSGLG